MSPCLEPRRAAPARWGHNKRCRCYVGLKPTSDAEVALSVSLGRRQHPTSVLCWSNVDVRQRRLPTSDKLSEQCRSQSMSNANISVVSAVVDVGCQRWRCVRVISASANISRRSRMQCRSSVGLGRRRCSVGLGRRRLLTSALCWSSVGLCQRQPPMLE